MSNESVTALWLDSVLAVPTVGIRIQSGCREAFRYCDELFPRISERFEDSPPITLEELGPKALDFTVNVPGMYQYGVTRTGSSVFVRFRYPKEEAKAPGSLPTLAEQQVRPYTTLLHGVMGEIQFLMDAISEIGEVSYDRVGIVSTCNMSLGGVPPGVDTFISHLSRPWEQGLLRAESTLVAQISDCEDYRDLGHHLLKFDRAGDPPDDLLLSLDWQRVFVGNRKYSPGSFGHTLKECEQACAEYSQKFAEGELRYE